MLRKERGQFDSACVGTPDHMHAPMAIGAMHRGVPVYLQKPLAHDIYRCPMPNSGPLTEAVLLARSPRISRIQAGVERCEG
jgi:hypothetical protein